MSTSQSSTPIGYDPNKFTSNMGALTRIEIALAENITVSKPNQFNQVTVTNSGTWTEQSFIPESASLSVSEKEVKEGLKYASSLSWKTARVTPSRYTEVNAWKNKRVVIRVTDANGVVMVIGSNEIPAYITTKTSLGKTTADLNHYESSVKYESPRQPGFSA